MDALKEWVKAINLVCLDKKTLTCEKITYKIMYVGADPVSAQTTKTKGELQMINDVTVGAVTHTQSSLINNKKINICAIFMYFSYRKNI